MADTAPTSYAETFQFYLDTNTIVGLNRVYPSPFRIQKLYWFAIVLVGICATGYHAYTMVHGYYGFRTKTVVFMASNSTIASPGITAHVQTLTVCARWHTGSAKRIDQLSIEQLSAANDSDICNDRSHEPRAKPTSSESQ